MQPFPLFKSKHSEKKQGKKMTRDLDRNFSTLHKQFSLVGLFMRQEYKYLLRAKLCLTVAFVDTLITLHIST